MAYEAIASVVQGCFAYPPGLSLAVATKPINQAVMPRSARVIPLILGSAGSRPESGQVWPRGEGLSYGE
jgi:hypothetical protein